MSRSRRRAPRPRANRAGNAVFGARRLHAPAAFVELRGVVAGSGRIRALGSGHSFSAAADTAGDLVSTEELPRLVEIDRGTRTAVIGSALRYGEFAAELHAAGLALGNTGCLPHLTVAGTARPAPTGRPTATALGTSVREIAYMGAGGRELRLRRGE